MPRAAPAPASAEPLDDERERPAEHPVADEPVGEAGREEPDKGLERVEVVERAGDGSCERRRDAADEGKRDDDVLAIARGLDGVVTQRFEDFARMGKHEHCTARPSALAHGLRATTVIPSRKLRGITLPSARYARFFREPWSK